MSGIPTPLLFLGFVAAAAITWVAGIALSKTTDELDQRLGFGEALGGMVLLAVAGSLPEVAITVSAAAGGHLDLAAGNLIGGIATQTMVLVMCDVFAPRPLTFLVGSLLPVLEGLLVVGMVSAVLMGSLLPASIAIGGRVSPASIAVVAIWLGGIWILNRTRNHPRWKVTLEGAKPGRAHRREPHPVAKSSFKKSSLAFVAVIFVVACVVTLVAGAALSVTGSEIAGRIGLNGLVFGATILALASALPEISSGIAAVRLGDHQLAVADIFGGNAFQLCLFLVADLIALKPVLPQAGAANSWLAALGVALTVVYMGGVIVRPTRPARLGPDSILAVGIYVIGIIGLLQLRG